jgi:uncharacterized protein (DUF488 family)
MPAIHTIGHSTRTEEEFLSILRTFGIRTILDIRTVPRSRHNPQYAQEQLREWLPRNGVGYLHLPGLGGLRHPRKDSVNTGWRNASFRGYADYMQTAPFETALEQLISIGSERSVAIMCAEAVPWRCHRSLVADALVIRNIDVHHIMSEKAAKPHVLTAWARVKGLSLSYPELSIELPPSELDP